MYIHIYIYGVYYIVQRPKFVVMTIYHAYIYIHPSMPRPRAYGYYTVYTGQSINTGNNIEIENKEEHKNINKRG